MPKQRRSRLGLTVRGQQQEPSREDRTRIRGPGPLEAGTSGLRAARIRTSDCQRGPIPQDIGQGVYVLLSPPAGPRVRLCLAGEDGNGDLCRTSKTVEVKPGDLREFEPIPDYPLIE